MAVKKAVLRKMESHPITNRMVNDKRYRVVTFAVLSLILNLIYAFYNGALGLIHQSVWFGATCVYYLLLSTMRFTAVISHRKGNYRGEVGTMAFTGAVLSVLSIVLTEIMIICLAENNAAVYGEITMITIAAYTFTKLILAIIRAVKSGKDKSPLMKVIRTIGYAEIAASVYSMQQSMLLSFGEMEQSKINVFNGFTGSAVCVFTLVLGIALMKRSVDYGKIEISSGE